jgi:flagellar FliL protein
MADESGGSSSGSSKGLMIILIVLIVALFGAVGFLGYMIMNNQPEEQNNTGGTEQQSSKKESTNEDGVFFITKIDNLVLNIINAKGREKLMKLSFSIKSTEPTIEAIVEANNAEIVDAVIGQISARTSEELLTVGGKALLKEEMLEEINSIINEATIANDEIQKNNVKKLFFTSFVIK